jgi:signal peptidase I
MRMATAPDPALAADDPRTVRTGDRVAARIPGGAREFVRRVRPALSLVASLYITIQLCLVAWVAVPAVALGWTPRVVLSNSMNSGLRAGDVVLVGRTPTGQLPVGTMVVFDDPETAASTIHRIVDNDLDGAYRTKGDANPTVDPAPVRREQVRGVGRLLVPLVGLPVMWFQTGSRALFVIWCLCAVSAVVLARRRGARRTKAAVP